MMAISTRYVDNGNQLTIIRELSEVEVEVFCGFQLLVGH